MYRLYLYRAYYKILRSRTMLSSVGEIKDWHRCVGGDRRPAENGRFVRSRQHELNEKKKLNIRTSRLPLYGYNRAMFIEPRYFSRAHV